MPTKELTKYEFELMSVSITDKVMFLLTKEDKYRDSSCHAISRLKQQGIIDDSMYREFVEGLNE